MVNKWFSFNLGKLLLGAVLATIAIILRSWNLNNQLFFGPEQGIDALVVYRMLHEGKLTLIGPKTDVAGIFHGPLFYYVSTFFYFIFAGNPVLVTTGFILLHAVTAWLVYLLAKELFNRRVALYAAILFVFSYGALAYSRWLSTHTLVFPLAVLFFWFYQKVYLQKEERYIPLLGVAFGLVAQAMFLNLLFFSFMLLAGMFLFKPKINTKLYWVLGILLAISFSTGHLLIFDLRHHFLILNAFVELLTGKRGFAAPLLMVFRAVLTAYFQEFVFLFTFERLFIGFTLLILVLLVLFFAREKPAAKVILLWILTPLFLLIFLRHRPLSHFFIGSLPGMVIALAYLLARLNKIGVIFLLILLGYNLWLWRTCLPDNRGMFFQAPQPRVNLAAQRNIIDFIYQDAGGKPFAFQAYTIPYYMSQNWQYLFWWYGKSRYKYMPGKEKRDLIYAIYQEDSGNQAFLDAWMGTVGNNRKEIIKAKFGVLGVSRFETQQDL